MKRLTGTAIAAALLASVAWGHPASAQVRVDDHARFHHRHHHWRHDDRLGVTVGSPAYYGPGYYGPGYGPGYYYPPAPRAGVSVTVPIR